MLLLVTGGNIGRSTESEWARRLRPARRRAPAVASPGIGKSALVQAAVTQAPEGDCETPGAIAIAFAIAIGKHPSIDGN